MGSKALAVTMSCIQATLAKINVLKGNFSKNNEETNVHTCNSFGGKCPHMPIFIGGANVRGAYVHHHTGSIISALT